MLVPTGSSARFAYKPTQVFDNQRTIEANFLSNGKSNIVTGNHEVFFNQ